MYAHVLLVRVIDLLKIDAPKELCWQLEGRLICSPLLP